MVSDVLSSLKEFVWDVIGYLIPGFVLIIVFNLVMIPSISLKNNFILDWEEFGPYLIIVVSYVLGFVVYSLTIFKVRLQDWLIDKIKSWLDKDSKSEFLDEHLYKRHSQHWEKRFNNSKLLLEAKIFLRNNGYQHAHDMNINELRNILMSRSPEMDQKVYTFMFRSSLFDHSSTILMLLVIAAIVQFICSFWSIYFMKTDDILIFFYLFSVFIIPLLGNCKRMFYGISKRIPFSNLKSTKNET